MKRRHSFLAGMAAGATALALLFVTFGFASCGDILGGGGEGDADTPITGSIAISGTPREGQTLTVVSNGIPANASALTYTWHRADTIDGVYNNTDKRGTTYTLTAADANKFLLVQAAASNYLDYLSSEPVKILAANDTTQVTEVQIGSSSETIVRGNTMQFTAVVNGQGNAGAELPAEYKGVSWTVSGNNSAGTTIDSNGLLTVAENETATTITVTATSLFDGTKSDSTVITVRSGNEPALTGTVTIPAAVRIGDNITANTTGLNGTGTISYEWQWLPSQSGGPVNLANATSNSYTISATDFTAGNYIRVRVTRDGYSGYVNSNAVYVRAQGVNLPAVTDFEIATAGDADEVAKGDSLYFWVTNVEGTDLSTYSDYEVTWSVNSVNPGTGFDIHVHGGGAGPDTYSHSYLDVAVNETQQTLIVTATSVVTNTVVKQKTITVKAADGYAIAITGMDGKSGEAQVLVMNTLDLDGSGMVASGKGEIFNNTLAVILTDDDDKPWTPAPAGTQYYIVVQTFLYGIMLDGTFVYTNGAALDMANLQTVPKYSLDGESSTIVFGTFKQVQMGEPGRQLTITGISGKNGSTAMVGIMDDTSSTMPLVAIGSGTVTNNSLTVTLNSYADLMSGWTGSGSYSIMLVVDNTDSYRYTNGQPIDWFDPDSTFPTYTFSGTSTTLALSAFAKMPNQYTVRITGPMNGTITDDDGDSFTGSHYAGDTVNLTVTTYPVGWEVASFHITNDEGRAIPFTHTAGYATVTFTMPASDVYVSAVVMHEDNITRTVTVMQSTGGTIAATPLSGKKGDTVWLNITPNSGYEFNASSLSVKDAHGTTVDISYGSGGAGGSGSEDIPYFILPASNVTVSGTFTKLAGAGVELSGNITFTGTPALNSGNYSDYANIYVSLTNPPPGDNDGYLGYQELTEDKNLTYQDLQNLSYSVLLPVGFDTPTSVTIRLNIDICTGSGSTYDYDSFTATQVVMVSDQDVVANLVVDMTRATVSGTVTINLTGTAATQAAGKKVDYMVAAITVPFTQFMQGAGEFVGQGFVNGNSWTMSIDPAYLGKNVYFVAAAGFEVESPTGETEYFQGYGEISGAKTIPSSGTGTIALGSVNITSFESMGGSGSEPGTGGSGSGGGNPGTGGSGPDGSYSRSVAPAAQPALQPKKPASKLWRLIQAR